MKIIFLDIDGVLNCKQHLVSLRKSKLGKAETQAQRLETLGETVRACGDEWERMIEDDCVKQLNRITQASGAKIVISSSWRYTLPEDKLKDVLKRAGVEASIVGVISKSCPTRADAIREWLGEHEVEAFVILDDEWKWTGLDSMRDDLILTNFDSGGLTKDLADEAIRRLK